ncbi:MAG: hypothetical protein JSV13_06715 [Nitrospiraceae bacterium]|nr:MAG: hypothetical protein JSV13_06715 [Nitrospiraceae bacterium]
MENDNVFIGIDFSLASQEVIDLLIEDPEGPDIFNEIAQANTHRPEMLKLLLNHPSTPEDVKKYIGSVLNLPATVISDLVKAGKDQAVEKAEKARERRTETIAQKTQKLNVSQRIQLALRGGREIRGLLVKDPNKEVMLSVLDNQKITESEVEMVARSRSVPEEALRRIAKNREWMKNYAVLLALVTNPKTPPGVAVTLVTNVKTKDLVILEKNRNVAEVVRSAAKKLLMWRKPR